MQKNDWRKGQSHLNGANGKSKTSFGSLRTKNTCYSTLKKVKRDEHLPWRRKRKV